MAEDRGAEGVTVTAIIPEQPIDVAPWREDEEWAQYPEGARPKSAHFPPAGLLPHFIKPARRYLFKRSAKRYPDQFWAEIAAYQLADQIGVEVPPAFPAINSAKGHCGALIEWFYEDGAALYVPGGNFMQQLIKDFDREHGWQHNFHAVRVIFRALQRDNLVVPDWQDEWVKVLLFDALCGNTDRHQDNWGLVIAVGDALAQLSPAFDNGTSLGHELSEAHQGKWSSADLIRYVRRGCHHMKWQLDDAGRLGHIDGMRKLASLSADKGTTMQVLLAGFDTDILRENLEKLSALPMPVALSRWRIDLICKLVETRRKLLIEALQ